MLLDAEVFAPSESLRDMAYREMRRQILHGEIAPGDAISERMLVKRLNVGLAAVRVAIQRLATQGFISVLPRRGIVVASQSIQDVIDLFEIRIMIEQRVARAIAGRLNATQIQELRDSVERMATAAETGDPAAVVESDFGFHRLMCEMYGNRHLTGLLDRILDGLYREVWTMTAKLPWQAAEVRAKHEGIIDAVERGDAAQAEKLIEEHLRLGEQCVLSRKPSA